MGNVASPQGAVAPRQLSLGSGLAPLKTTVSFRRISMGVLGPFSESIPFTISSPSPGVPSTPKVALIWP
jgi:hypothetical protein